MDWLLLLLLLPALVILGVATQLADPGSTVRILGRLGRADGAQLRKL